MTSLSRGSRPGRAYGRAARSAVELPAVSRRSSFAPKATPRTVVRCVLRLRRDRSFRSRSRAQLFAQGASAHGQRLVRLGPERHRLRHRLPRVSELLCFRHARRRREDHAPRLGSWVAEPSSTPTRPRHWTRVPSSPTAMGRALRRRRAAGAVEGTPRAAGDPGAGGLGKTSTRAGTTRLRRG